MYRHITQNYEELEILKDHVSGECSTIFISDLFIDEHIAKAINTLIYISGYTRNYNPAYWLKTVEDTLQYIFSNAEKRHYCVHLVFKNCEFDSVDSYPYICSDSEECKILSVAFENCTLHKLQIGHKESILGCGSNLSISFINTKGTLNLKNLIFAGEYRTDILFAYQSDVSIVLDNSSFLTPQLQWAICQMDGSIPPVGTINTFTHSKNIKESSKLIRKLNKKRRDLDSPISAAFKNTKGADNIKQTTERNFMKSIRMADISEKKHIPSAILMVPDSEECYPDLLKYEGTVIDGILISQVMRLSSRPFSVNHLNSTSCDILRSRIQLINSSGLYILSRRGTDSEVSKYIKFKADMEEKGKFQVKRISNCRIDYNPVNQESFKIDIRRTFPALKNPANTFLLPVGGAYNIKEDIENGKDVLSSSFAETLREVNKLSEAIAYFDTILYSGDEYTRQSFYDNCFD